MIPHMIDTDGLLVVWDHQVYLMGPPLTLAIGAMVMSNESEVIVGSL